MGGAEIDAFLRGFAGEEAIGETAGETVAATDAVFDLEVFESAAFVEFAVHVENRRPVVDEAGFDLAERGADDLDVGIGLDDLLDHFLVGGGVEGGEVFIDAFDFEAEDFLEIFFVADEAIEMGDEFLGDLLGLLVRSRVWSGNSGRS